MKLSCCVILLLFVISDSLALDTIQKAFIKAKFLTSGISCLQDYPLVFSQVKLIKKKILPKGVKAQCFAECLFKQIGLMDDKGKLSAAKARESAVELFKDNKENLDNVENFVMECSIANDIEYSEAEIKSCERAKLAFKCLVDNAPKFGLEINF